MSWINKLPFQCLIIKVGVQRLNITVEVQVILPCVLLEKDNYIFKNLSRKRLEHNN